MSKPKAPTPTPPPQQEEDGHTREINQVQSVKVPTKDLIAYLERSYIEAQQALAAAKEPLIKQQDMVIDAQDRVMKALQNLMATKEQYNNTIMQEAQKKLDAVKAAAGETKESKPAAKPAESKNEETEETKAPAKKKRPSRPVVSADQLASHLNNKAGAEQ